MFTSNNARVTSSYVPKLGTSKPMSKAGHILQGARKQKAYALMDQVMREPVTGKVLELDVKRIYHTPKGTFGIVKLDGEPRKVRRIGESVAWEFVSK